MMRLDTLVSEAFKSHGDNEFVVGLDYSLTYDQCFQRIEILKDTLLNLELTQAPIAILCSDKMQSLFSILASLLARNAYVPLDSLAPIDRNINILSDNDIPNLIVSKDIYNLNASDFKLKIPHSKVDLEVIDAYLIQIENVSSKLSEDLAYILFTSGSTGKAKGIKISHSNALAFILWAKELTSLENRLRFCSVAPFQFDLSVYDIYVSILSGGSLFLFENEDIRNPRMMTQVIDEFLIQVIYTTPTIYSLLWTYGKMKNRKMSSLECIIFAGEVMQNRLLNKLKNRCPEAKFYNFYGPTETNVCTFHDATDSHLEEDNGVAIGIICPYSKYQIKNKTSESTGELWIAGKSVFMGYLNNDELTQIKLTEDNGSIWYATGDLVYQDKSGLLHYVSRIDRMVKVNGYRIELNEIENVILTLPQIKLCAVIVKEEEEESKIIAYLKTKTSLKNDVLDIEPIRLHCAKLLPQYMMPKSFIFVDEMPINSNSKVDYKLLSRW